MERWSVEGGRGTGARREERMAGGGRWEWGWRVEVEEGNGGVGRGGGEKGGGEEESTKTSRLCLARRLV